MTPGIQEAIALAIVVLVVGFGLYRRWRKGKRQESACCSENSASEPEEQTVHFYKRDSN
ncbi:MAG: hypothetical protein JSV45_13900 [Chromatiales bacterium]|nr:MAG: hypothetical protein JSV45_13900 [Chromatiales bacterium]